MSRRHDIIRWSASCAIVLTCYAAAATAIFAWEPHYEAPAAPLTVALIDLAPLPPEPTPPAPPPPPEPEVIPEAPPEVKVDVPLPPVKKPPPPKIKREDPPPAPIAAPVETAAVPLLVPRIAVRNDPSPSALAQYAARLSAHVQGNLRYPKAAQTRSEQGTAYVVLRLDRSGKVLSSKLDGSSNRRLLDEEAVAVILRADPMPPFPAEIEQSELELRLPVNFKLR